MPAAPDLQSLADAAEHAASAGDYAAAEQHLRLAVELQEASAGPMHPDLANALNNLGVVCERIGKSADAEGCYRRAYAIASTVLPADHPFVALSARNLRDFCEARGIPFEQPVAPLPAPALAEKAVGPDFSRARKPEAVSPPPQPVQHPRRGLAVAAALGALALIAIAIVATRSRSTSSPAAAAPSVPSPAASTVAPRNPAPVAETPAPSAPAPDAPDARNAPDAPVAPGVSVAPTLVSAELCRTLETSGSEWRCAPANGVLQPGTFVFYTRVASPTDATIEHRWYRNDRLHQTVPLRVRANQRNGFRTYSRMTVSADRTGEWRVELRTRNGDILHEERFTVAP